jgi:hypothetical protein
MSGITMGSMEPFLAFDSTHRAMVRSSDDTDAQGDRPTLRSITPTDKS